MPYFQRERLNLANSLALHKLIKTMNLLNKIPRWIQSKYLIAVVAFTIWMCFFDRNDLTLQWKRINELRKLQKSETFMNGLISGTKSELDLLKTNPSTLERYAREKYMMKKDNEDLFIITPNEKQ